MNKSIRKNVNLKITTFLRSAICVGVFSLAFASNALAGGGSSTPPPCGGWNDAYSFTLSQGATLLGVVAKLPLNKPTPLAGVDVEFKQGIKQPFVLKTGEHGEYVAMMLDAGKWNVRVKKAGHRFHSRDSNTIYMTSCN